MSNIAQEIQAAGANKAPRSSLAEIEGAEGMSTTHTPGPWRVVAVDWSPEGNARFEIEGVHRTGIADARLIGAAPELLAALEGMEKWASSIYDGYPPSTASIAAAPYREAARAAIAKATGEVK